MNIVKCRASAAGLCAIVLASCGGGGSDGGTGNPPPTPPPQSTTYTIGGTVTGLNGTGLVLQNNGGNDLTISSGGSFAFSTALASGAAYSVTVRTQPTGNGPVQNCSVSNGGGTTGAANVTSVTVTCSARVGKFLYVPNLNSSDISAYSINATTGALTAVAGSPFPSAVAPALPSANRGGTYLYVPSRGSFIAPPKISAYSINATTGALTHVLGSPFDLSHPPPFNGTVPTGKPLIHPTGAFGYFGLAAIGQLFGATVDSSGGLIEIPGLPLTLGAVGVSQLAFNAAGTVLYAAHSNNAGITGAVSVFSVNAPSGVLTPQGSYPSGGITTMSVYLDPTGRILFAPNGSSGTLSAFVVDATNGSLSPVAGSPFPTGGSSVNSATAHPTKNFVYATNSNITTPTNPLPSSVAAFRFDTTTGVLTPIAGSPFATGGTVAVLATVDPYGKFLFVTNRGTSTIQSFGIDQTTGALTPAPGSPFATEPNPTAVLLDPSGRYLYSANESGNTVSSYAIDGITGALTLVNTLPSGAAPGFFELVGLQ